MKTSELTGEALNWAVTKAIGDYSPAEVPKYSTDWAQGGPIIDRETIQLVPVSNPDYWIAMHPDSDRYRGPTPLVAAMRCYVASKLGDEVEIPKELLCTA